MHNRSALLLVGVFSACSLDTTAPPSLDTSCDRGVEEDGTPIAGCLLAGHVISLATYDAAKPVIDRAAVVRDALRLLVSSNAYLRGADIARALQKLDNYYARGILDSVRFDRLVDHVAVTTANSLGQHATASGLYYPTRTPNLVWAGELQPGYGIFFQPVVTINTSGLYAGSVTATTDSLVRVGSALYQYATWMRAPDGQRFPLWLYDFDWAAGVSVQGPWRSGLAQGLALQAFVNLYSRTGDQIWKERAAEVAVSLKVTWDRGGVLLNDADGAWWEEYHPMVRIWNGDVWTLLAIGEYLKIQPDGDLSRLYTLGVQAARIYAQRYDTGTWLLYSRAEKVSVPYRDMYVALARQLGAQSGDPYFAAAATRWAAYATPASLATQPSAMSSVPRDLNAMLDVRIP